MATDKLTIHVDCPECGDPLPLPTTNQLTGLQQAEIRFDTSGLRDHIAGHLRAGATPGRAVQVVSDAGIWPTISRDSERLAQLLDWLRANGIDPNIVPTNSALSVEPDPDGGHLIRYTAHAANDTGAKIHPERREERTAPVVVPLPGPWPQPVFEAAP